MDPPGGSRAGQEAPPPPDLRVPSHNSGDAELYHSDDEGAYSDDDPVADISTGQARASEDAGADGEGPGLMPQMAEEDMKLYQVASTFSGAAAVAMVQRPRAKAPKAASPSKPTGDNFREKLGVRSSRRHSQGQQGDSSNTSSRRPKPGEAPAAGAASLGLQGESEAAASPRSPGSRAGAGGPLAEGGAPAADQQGRGTNGNALAHEHDAVPLKEADVSSSSRELRKLPTLGSGAEKAASAEMEKVLMITMEDGVTLEVELDSGEKRLNELGYKQELRRVLSFWQLYGVGVSIISIFTGIVPTFGQTMLNGGPAAAVWFWWIAVFFVHCVGLSFAEIASSFPTAGSLYFWASALAPPKWSAAAAFFTGWFSYIGLVFQSAAASFGGAVMIQMLVLISTGGADNGGTQLSTTQVFGVAVALLVLSSSLVLLPVDFVANAFLFSSIVQVLGGVALMICLPCVAVETQPASFVFGDFEVQWDIAHTPNVGYAVVIGMLMSQYSLYGYDGVVHLAEETKVADLTGPQAIMGSITTVSLVEWGIVVALCFCVQTIPELFDPDTATGGAQPVVQILWDTFYGRYGSIAGVQFFTFIIFFSFPFTASANILGASRVCYSLSRDGGFPLSRVWKKVHASSGVPLNATVFSAAVGLVLLLPLLGTATVFNAIISMSTVGWVGSYAIPLYLRLVQDEVDFKPGPFYLGDYVGRLGGKIVHALALFWVVYTVIVFNLPTQFPITATNFNWAPVATAVWGSLLVLWWYIDARHWFLGPVLRLEKLRLKSSQPAV